MGFETCHPAVNFIYFAAVLFGTLTFRHPLFLGISFVSALAYSLKRQGRRGLIFALWLLPCIAGFALYYSCYHHFGMTVLSQNFIGNNMTLESLVYGLVLALAAAAALMWMSCVHTVLTADKTVYLFGRVSPRLALALAIALRMVPRLKTQARRIHTARKALGRGIDQGNIFQRMKNGICIFSMLISWFIGAMATASDSMRSRGSALRGRKAFSIYRFDGRDRLYVIVMFFCLTLTAMAFLLGQTDMVYDPLIRWEGMGDPVFWLGYGLLCLMPLGLEWWNQWRFQRQIRRMRSAIV